MRVFLLGSNPLSEKDADHGSIQAGLENLAFTVGTNVALAGLELVVCSPFDDSADRKAVEGYGSDGITRAIEFHTPSEQAVLDAWVNLLANLPSLKPRDFKHPPPMTISGWRTAWLFCQIQALECSQIVIALGGRREGTSHLLLQIAEAQGKIVLPLPGLSGAAEDAYMRLFYRLQDLLGEEVLESLHEPSVAAEAVRTVLDAAANPKAEPRKNLVDGASADRGPKTIFISYSRRETDLADAAEVALRRRGHIVHRDESDFSVGAPLPEEIRAWLFRSDVILILYSANYAVSQWCFDEFEMALDRVGMGQCRLWILKLDGASIIPKRARSLLFHTASTREDVVSIVHNLLIRMQTELTK